MFALFGVSWVMPRMVSHMLSCWEVKFQSHRGGKIWKVALLCGKIE